MSIAQTMRPVSINLSILFVLWLASCAAGWPSAAVAQAPVAPPEAADREPPRRVAIRFLTESDFPPFNYFDEDNLLTGFNVDIARAVCLELNATCDIQVRAWSDLLPALAKGEADAVIASHTPSPGILKQLDFSEPYYFTPGRFAVRRGLGPLE